MKAIGAALLALVAAYLADQQFAQGKYTSATRQMIAQIRHSTGL